MFNLYVFVYSRVNCIFERAGKISSCLDFYIKVFTCLRHSSMYTGLHSKLDAYLWLQCYFTYILPYVNDRLYTSSLRLSRYKSRSTEISLVVPKFDGDSKLNQGAKDHSHLPKLFFVDL